MKNYSVKQTPENLGFQASFIETGRQYEVEDLRQTRNVINLRANLCFTWVAALLDRLGFGETIIGKIAYSLPLPNPGNHKRYFIGGLLLYAALALVLSGLYALVTGTTAGGFKVQFFESLGAFTGLYVLIAAALYGLFLLRHLINNQMPPEFWRTISVSASDMEVVIDSAQDRLRTESWGYFYRPKVIRMSQVAGIEDHHIHAHNASAGQMTSTETISETNNCYEVSLFTTDGKRHLLMRDVCGPDNARELRTKLAALVHKAQSVIPHIQRLYAANAYDTAAEQRLRDMLYASNTSAASPHTATPFLNAVPESDRL